MSRPARSTLPSALTLILGVLIGLASAWSYKLIQEPESPSALELGPQGATAHSPAEPPPSEVTPAQEAREDRKETSPAPAASASAAPPRVPQPGPCRIYGRVTDESGAPIPDATIFSLADRGPLAADFLDWPFDRQAEELRLRQSSRCVSRTNQRGTYEISGLPLQSYEITGKSENRILQLSGSSIEKFKISSQELSRASQSVEVNFIAVLGAGILLKVLGPSGEAIQEAALHFKAIESWFDTKQPWSATKPILNLPRGIHNFTVTAGEHDRLRSDLFSLDLTSNSHPTTLEIRLREPPGLEVSIRANREIDFDSRSLSIYAYPIDGEPPPDSVILSSYEPRIWLDELDDNPGQFYTNDINPGQYLIATVLGNSIIARTTVTVDQGLTRTEVLLSLDDSNTLRLIALDPTGQPISNLRSELNCGSTNPLEIETAALRSGNEWLILFDQAKLQNKPNDSTMYLNVFTKFGLGTIKFQIGELGPWTLRFSSPARLEVEVTGLRGSGFEAGLRVYIFKPNSNTPPIYTEKLNSEGRASFVSLPAAEVEVKLALSRDWGTIRFAERRITLSPGMNTLQISAPPASPLRISTTPGYQLSLEGFSNQTFFDSSWQPADPNGLADFGLVPHGRWSLFTLDWSDNFPVKIIEHRGPQDITVDFLKFSALLVKELDTPHHGIDLREDDQITKINSKRFRNASELSAIEDEFTKESAIKLTITRAGALREVSISMEKWSELRTWALVD